MFFWVLETLRIHTKMRIWGPVGAVWTTPLRFPASNVIWIAACKLLAMRRLLVIRQIQGNLNPLWLVELLAVAVLSFQAAITFQHGLRPSGIFPHATGDPCFLLRKLQVAPCHFGLGWHFRLHSCNMLQLSFAYWNYSQRFLSQPRS